MARKVSAKDKAPGKAGNAEPGADDLDVLHPDRPLTIGGRQLLVREYGFIEGMRVLPLLQGFLADLKPLLAAAGPLYIGDIQVSLARHIEAISEAVAIAADVEPEWLANLDQTDGMTLLMVWWSVNGPFYVRSVSNQIAADLAVAQAGAGQTSTQP